MDRVVIDPPCVDVIIPVCNGRDTIHATLTSVLNQQGAFIRSVIVIDDGSIDDTPLVVQQMSSPLIKLVRTPNQGVANARNLGIDLSTAEWVAFLDADDVWLPNKLQAQLAAARAHGAGFVCAAISGESQLISAPISPKTLALGNFVATSSVLVKRSILKQITPVFSPGMSFAEDYLAWLKCVTLTPGYFLSTKLVDYILSDRPRYRWGQILRNLIALNVRYARFLSRTDTGTWQRSELALLVFLGTLCSVLSIIKRFLRS